MDRQSLTKRQREHLAGEELAARLDALTIPLANRVLGRAIELDGEARAAAEAAADTMDYDTLKDVAAEVGISESSLKTALLEELDTEKDRGASAVQRATVPNAIRGGAIAPGTLDEVVRRLRKHLEGVEGLDARRADANPSVWVNSETGRPVEVWTVTQNRPDRQLVEIGVDTRRTRMKAWRWFIAALVLASLFGSAFGPLVFLGLFVAGIASVFSWMKRIARGIRRNVNRTLGAVVDEYGDVPRSWLELWERSQR